MDNLGDLPPEGEVRRGIVPFAGEPIQSSDAFGNSLTWPKQRIGSVGYLYMRLQGESEEHARSSFQDRDEAITFDPEGNLVSIGKIRDAMRKGYGRLAGYILPRIGQVKQIGEKQQVELGINAETFIIGEVQTVEQGEDLIYFGVPELHKIFVLKNDPELLSKIRLSISSKPRGGEN